MAGADGLYGVVCGGAAGCGAQSVHSSVLGVPRSDDRPLLDHPAHDPPGLIMCHQPRECDETDEVVVAPCSCTLTVRDDPPLRLALLKAGLERRRSRADRRADAPASSAPKIAESSASTAESKSASPLRAPGPPARVAIAESDCEWPSARGPAAGRSRTPLDAESLRRSPGCSGREDSEADARGVPCRGDVAEDEDPEPSGVRGWPGRRGGRRPCSRAHVVASTVTSGTPTSLA